MKKMKLGKSERITMEVTTFSVDKGIFAETEIEKQYFHFTEISKFHEFFIGNIRVVIKIINQINEK